MGIRAKLALPLIITLVVLLAFVHTVFRNDMIEHMGGHFIKQQAELLDTHAARAINYILSGNYAQMYEDIDKDLELKAKFWKAMVVQLDSGEQIYPIVEMPEINDAAGIDRNIEVIKRELIYNGSSLGSITLYVDWTQEVQEVDKQVGELELMLLASFLVLILAALTMQSAWLREPIEKLQNAAMALAQGDYDAEVPVCGNDEIGRLSISFHKMRECIKQNAEDMEMSRHEAEAAEQLLQVNQQALLEEHVSAMTALDEVRLINQKLHSTRNELEHMRIALDEHAIVSMADVSGNIIFVNEKFCAISGYTSKELIGQNHRILKSGYHVPEYYVDLWHTISAGKVWHGNLCNLTKDGEEYWVEATIIPFLDDEKNPYKYVAIRTDISEQVRAAERLKIKASELNDVNAVLKQTHQQALHAEKLASVGQLAAGIAHEINTPIQFIGDNTRFLQEAFEDMSSLVSAYEKLQQAVSDGDPHEELLNKTSQLSDEVEMDYLVDEVPNAIGQTLEGVERVRKIVLSMKDFSHPGSEQKEHIDINHAIESTITVSRNEWKYNAELETEFDERLNAVPCYAGELNQVILNIIVNASHAIQDATEEGEMGKIRISTMKVDEYAEIRITDNGSGMPESVRKRIFEPFFTTKGVGKGSGQGLAIAYSVIVEKHAGALDVESVQGEGTTFILRLPMREEKSAGAISQVDDDSEGLRIMGGGAS